MKMLRTLSLCFLVMSAAGVTAAHAQSTATLSGTVKDPSGAVLPGAKITLHSVGTGADRVVTSDSAGDYAIPSLQPGEYTLMAKMAGFASYTIKSLVLQVDQKIQVGITMGLASAAETVQVEAGAPLIETGTITVGEVLDKQVVQEIPLNGRHFLDLTTLTPGGVTAPATGSLTAPSRGVGAFSFDTAGNREDSVNFQINGINLNDINNAQIVFQPSINTTSEVKIDNSTFSAEYGRNSGSIVNVSTRSGTNQFHGEVFDYVRNNSFDARNFFNPKGSPQIALKRNNFGAAVGGPLWKDHTFFFGSYEALRQHQGLPINTIVLSPAQQAAVTDPISKQLLQFIPLPNAGTNYNSSINGPITIDQGTIDILNNLRTRDTIHGFYAYQLDVRTEPTTQGNTLPGFGDHRPGHRQILTVNETHVFSPRLVNEFRAGYNRVAVKFINNYAANPTSFGYNNYPAGATPTGGIPFTTISTTGIAIGGPGGFPSGRYDSLGVISDTATYTVGKHSIKFGGEGRRYLNANFADDPGSVTFGTSGTICTAYNAAKTGCSSAATTVQTGQTGIPNFQAGTATSFSITPQPTTSRIYADSVGAFIMDDFKVTPNVLLEYGFRFEWNGSPYFGNHRATIFDPVTVTLNQYDTNGYNSPYKQNYNYMPRLGFTWDIFGNSKTVMRGGYSILSDQPLSSVVTGLSSNPPFTTKVSYTASSSLCLQGTAGCNPAIPQENLYAAAAAASISVSAVQPNYKNATTQTFNLAVAQELPGHTALTLGYYGSVGRHLKMGSNINQIFPSTGARAFTTISASSPIDPGASINSNVTELTSNGISNYNAMWLNVKTHAGRAVDLLATYQYSKSMDLGSLGGTQFTDITQPRLNYGLSDFDVRNRISGNGIYRFQIPFKSKAVERITQGYQISGIVQYQTGNPLNITTTSTYTGTSGVQHPNLIAPIPYSKTYTASGVTWFGNGTGTTPGAIACTQAATTAGCVFQTPTTGFGNMERNGATGPGFFDVDASLSKDTKITERVRFILKIDAFDLFNHASFSNPGTSAVPGSATFGIITATRFPVGDLGSSRQLQLSGKITF
jgi:hypothetical protein